MSLKQDGNVQNHFNQMRIYYNRLLVSGQTYSDEEFASTMLESLPRQYSILAGVVYQSRDLTSDMVEEAITTEWERLGMPGKDEEELAPDEHGLFAKAKTTSNKNAPRKKFHCTEHPSANSHDTKDCFMLKRKAKDRNPDSDDAFETAAVANVGEDEYVDIFGMVAVTSVGLVGEVANESTYIIDSGASQHMVGSSNDLTNLVPIKPHGITVGGQNVVYASHKGTLELGKLKLRDVLYVPKLGFNLLSVDKLGQAGFKTHFEDDSCVVVDPTGSDILRVKGNGLYEIKASTASTSLVARNHSADTLLYLHRSLGHLNWADMYKLDGVGNLVMSGETLYLRKT